MPNIMLIPVYTAKKFDMHIFSIHCTKHKGGKRLKAGMYSRRTALPYDLKKKNNYTIDLDCPASAAVT